MIAAPTRVAIGVHVHAEPAGLLATLAGLRAGTWMPVELYLLPDEPDAATCAMLGNLSDLPQLATPSKAGAAACFNRLAAATDTAVIVLLESGAVVGPSWLDYLLAALAADSRNGLAGPSTNRAWNEQNVFSKALGTPAHVARTSRDAARRFGGVCRTLEPLYSLADFCYAVRREVITAIGAADEDYGRGPCWEMDYNVRAARAGWRGVWACAAYVYRPPPTGRRIREEAQFFARSKHRYQDKFCALRLNGEHPAYESHCRGDDCEHFAPPTLIELRRPLPPPVQVPLSVRVCEPAAELPLVSCIMPTRNRPEFALQAIRYFERQDYPERELIIVDDGDENLTPLLPGGGRIRYLRLPSPQSIGVKRNLACELARGTFIAQWDDDDWYAPDRLRVQVAPLIAGRADITGLVTRTFFELESWTFWTCTPGLHKRIFVLDVHGGTLTYHRRVWEETARYPDRSLAEDAGFLRDAVRRGARLQRLLQPRELFIYLRHGANTWGFTCGRSFNARDWVRIGEPPLPPPDRAFYAERAAVAAALRNRAQSTSAAAAQAAG
jgi:GT2 family glycosyltransferase